MPSCLFVVYALQLWQLVVAFPAREDVTDEMDEEGLRELSQLMQLLKQVRLFFREQLILLFGLGK